MPFQELDEVPVELYGRGIQFQLNYTAMEFRRQTIWPIDSSLSNQMTRKALRQDTPIRFPKRTKTSPCLVQNRISTVTPRLPQLRRHRFDDLLEQGSVIRLREEYHLPSALVRERRRAIPQDCGRGPGDLQKQPVVVDSAEQDPVLVQEVLAHHLAVGDVRQYGLHRVQSLLMRCHRLASAWGIRIRSRTYRSSWLCTTRKPTPPPARGPRPSSRSHR